jgi:hypothetical protein
MKTSTIVTIKNTRELARKFIRDAKEAGITGFNQPIKAYGKWFIESKPKQVLTLKKGV